MVEIKEQDWGFLIENVVLFGADTMDADFVNLAKEKGEEMHYDKNEYKFIDFPGEYDLNGLIIKCIVAKNQKLSYVISHDGEKIGLVQAASALKNDAISNVDVWLYSDIKIADKIDHMELDGYKQELKVIA